VNPAPHKIVEAEEDLGVPAGDDRPVLKPEVEEVTEYVEGLSFPADFRKEGGEEPDLTFLPLLTLVPEMRIRYEIDLSYGL